MATFVGLLLPMPFAARKKLFTFLSTSPVVAKIAYGLKIAFVYVGDDQSANTLLLTSYPLCRIYLSSGQPAS